MLAYVTFVVFCCLIVAQATVESPKIIIIGSGASAIAAASRLLQNGFDSVKILEAEDRIGGRIHTTEFGGYLADLGAQWVHGEEDNVAFELAWPLGVLEHYEHSDQKWPTNMFGSSGSQIPEETAFNLINYYMNLTQSDTPNEYLNSSIGEYYKPKIDEYFESHSDIKTEQREPLEHMLNLYRMSADAGDSWFNVSAKGLQEYVECKGDQAINWKNRGYSTILDILMKKLPNPEEELPVLNNTHLNKEVSQINYSLLDGSIIVTTADGDQYPADHVIVTTSLGVLKSDYETLFNPPLPQGKIDVIKGLEFGNVAKIYLHFPEPWWTVNATEGPFTVGFHWTEKDRNEFANDPEKSWMLGLFSIINVEHKPQLLCAWMSGPHAREMELIPEEIVFNKTTEFLHRFLGNKYNITKPTAMLRTQWFSNKHFRGTWSYRSLETERSGAMAIELSEPIIKNGKPIILFAGEATSPKYFSTVHGAIGSGWREADRLIKLYADHRRSKKPKISCWDEKSLQLLSEEKAALKSLLDAGKWQSVEALRQKSR